MSKLPRFYVRRYGRGLTVKIWNRYLWLVLPQNGGFQVTLSGPVQ